MTDLGKILHQAIKRRAINNANVSALFSDGRASIDGDIDLSQVADDFLRELKDRTRPDAVYGATSSCIIQLPDKFTRIYLTDGTEETGTLPSGTFVIYIGPLKG